MKICPKADNKKTSIYDKSPMPPFWSKAEACDMRALTGLNFKHIKTMHHVCNPLNVLHDELYKYVPSV